MESFGLSVAALAAFAAPGVLSMIAFLSASLIKRTSISFGPAIDIAFFLFLSLLMNGFYGGFVGWFASTCFKLCGQPPILPEVVSVIQQLAFGSPVASLSSIISVTLFSFLYLILLSIFSIFIGYWFTFIYESSSSIFFNHVFSGSSQLGRLGGTTICSVLCKFGGTDSFVIYVGELQEVLVNDEHSIAYIRISRVLRAIMKVGVGDDGDRIWASPPETVPHISLSDDLVITGAEIENIALTYLRPYSSIQKRNEQLKFRYWVYLLVPFLSSLFIYAILLLNLSTVSARDHTKTLEQAAGQLQFNGAQIQFNNEILKSFDTISARLGRLGPPLPPPGPAGSFAVIFGFDSAALTLSDTGVIASAASAYRSSEPAFIEVSGYADPVGIASYNRGLSERRAKAVAEQLAADGVPLANIYIHANGSTSSSLKTGAAGFAEERRVEITVE